MSTNIKLKRSAVQGKVPTTVDLDFGELAINTFDGKVYLKKDDGTPQVIQIGGTSATDPNITVDNFTGDGSTTDYILSTRPLDDQYVIVTINGVQQNITEYTVTESSLSFTEAPANNDLIETRVIDTITAEIELHDYKTYIFEANNDTTFSGSDLNINTLSYEPGFVDVYVNGLKLISGTDYTANDETSVVLDSAVTGDVEIISYGRAKLVDSVLTTNQATLASNTANQVVDSFSIHQFRTAKYLIQMTEGTDYHVTEATVLHDGANTFISEYGTIFTNVSLGDVSSDISSGSVRLLVSPISANTEIKTSRISLTV